MALFKKKPTTDKAQPEVAQEPVPERSVQQATLSSGRMAAVFLRMYRWIFSVSLSRDVYQIESGADTCGEGALPIRGYYHDLLNTLSRYITKEQREDFLKRFSADMISYTASHGATSLTGIFCADFDATLAPADNPNGAPPPDPKLAWYEVRAELLKDSTPGNLLFIFYFRNIRDDVDDGRVTPSVNIPPAHTEEEWSEVRVKRLLGSASAIRFEYDVVNDVMYVHRHRGGDHGDRTTQNFLNVLNARSDWLVNHESVAQVKRLLRAEPNRGVESAEILYRKDGTFGAPFRHYRITAVPLEEQGTPTWILGMLEDVEERSQRARQNEEITMELGRILEMYQITLYEIRAESNQLYGIIQDENGFRRGDNARNLSDYINRSIDNGTIAPESAENYRSWLSPAKMSKLTSRGAWEFESRLRPPGATEYRWYSESILPLGKTGGRYIRWRSDITDAHAAREKEYELKEMTHLAEYNGAILDSMAGLVEFRNIESGHHIRNVRELTRILFNDIVRRSAQYDIPPYQVRLYVQASAMHDIGKITIPDSILNKAGPYTPEEYERMKQHTVQGARIVDRLEMPGQDELKAIVRDVVLHHHERWDGRGYPDGLVGDEIALGVQIVSMADVFDALVSERCYKQSFPVDEALKMIINGESGTFNPVLLESLKACKDQLSALYTDTKEGDPDGRETEDQERQQTAHRI